MDPQLVLMADHLLTTMLRRPAISQLLVNYHYDLALATMLSFAVTSILIKNIQVYLQREKRGEDEKHVLLTYPSAHSSLARRLSASFFPRFNVSHLCGGKDPLTKLHTSTLTDPTTCTPNNVKAVYLTQSISHDMCYIRNYHLSENCPVNLFLDYDQEISSNKQGITSR